METPTPESPAASAEAPSAAPAEGSGPELVSPARAQARLAAAIELIGGAERVKEALAPKQNEKGEPLKWAAVCADASEGLAPGDPVFLAWVRLASTPVREIKAQVRPPREDRGGRGGQGGSRRGGSGGGRPGSGGREGGRGGRGGGSRSLEEAAKGLLSDGSFRPTVRIVGPDDDEKKERERQRKAKREAKREAERERLARLGY